MSPVKSLVKEYVIEREADTKDSSVIAFHSHSIDNHIPCSAASCGDQSAVTVTASRLTGLKPLAHSSFNGFFPTRIRKGDQWVGTSKKGAQLNDIKHIFDQFFKDQFETEVVDNAVSLICEAEDEEGVEAVLNALGCMQLIDDVGHRMFR